METLIYSYRDLRSISMKQQAVDLSQGLYLLISSQGHLTLLDRGLMGNYSGQITSYMDKAVPAIIGQKGIIPKGPKY